MASPSHIAAQSQQGITRLRQTLSLAGRTRGLAGEYDISIALGIGRIDAALAGGFACGALHEFAAACESESLAATAFTLAVIARLLKQSCCLGHRHCCVQNEASMAGRAVLWVADDLSLLEHGSLYGPGLDEAGVAPERLITVAAPHSRDVLWVMEEALRCRAVGAVIGEIRPRALEQISMRRLSLAAAVGGTLGIVLRPQPVNEPSTFATRWIIEPAAVQPSSSLRQCPGVGPLRLRTRLVRNRRGHLGEWIVEWNSVEQRFELATNSQPMAGAPFDRPHCAATA